MGDTPSPYIEPFFFPATIGLQGFSDLVLFSGLILSPQEDQEDCTHWQDLPGFWSLLLLQCSDFQYLSFHLGWYLFPQEHPTDVEVKSQISLMADV